MAQPAKRRHEIPTVYLMGFSCLPGDREYSEAQRATGSATPYWFKERHVYGGVQAKPHTRTMTAAEPKSDMANVRVGGEKEKAAKKESREKLGSEEEQGKGNRGIKQTKNEKMKTKESKKNDKKIQKKDGKEKREKNKKKKKAHNPRRNKSPLKRTKTVLLPGKRVRFAWTIAVMPKRRVTHTSCIKPLYERSLVHGTQPQPTKSNSSDNTGINKTAAEDIETVHLLDSFPSPPRTRQPTPSISDDVSQQQQQQQPEEQEQEQEQEQAREETRAALLPLPLPQSQSQNKSLDPAQLQIREDTDTSSNHVPERDEPDTHGTQEGEKTSVWSACLCFCFGKRK